MAGAGGASISSAAKAAASSMARGGRSNGVARAPTTLVIDGTSAPTTVTGDVEIHGPWQISRNSDIGNWYFDGIELIFPIDAT